MLLKVVSCPIFLVRKPFCHDGPRPGRQVMRCGPRRDDVMRWPPQATLANIRALILLFANRAKMATSGRSALLSSTSAGPKSILDNQNPEEDEGQDLWWGRRVVRAEFIRGSLSVPGANYRLLWSIVIGGRGEDGLTVSSCANKAS